MHSARQVSVVLFRPHPTCKGPCALHREADDGTWKGCWRAVPTRTPKVILLEPGQQVPCCPELVPRPGASSKTALAQHCFRKCNPLEHSSTPPSIRAEQALLRASATSTPAHNLSDESVSANAQTVVTDITTRTLAYRCIPHHCPQAQAADGPCQIIKRGHRPAGKFLTAAGCWNCSAQLYSCRSHGFRWNLPVGPNSLGATLVGDLFGHCLVHASFWPVAWEIYHATESYIALERHVRRMAEAGMSTAVADHPLVPGPSTDEQAYVHGALLHHCLATPDWKTLRAWLLRYLLTKCTPADVLSIATEAIACHGAMCNIDFSCSDGKQLQRHKKRGSVKPAATSNSASRHVKPRRFKQSKLAVLRKIASLRFATPSTQQELDDGAAALDWVMCHCYHRCGRVLKTITARCCFCKCFCDSVSTAETDLCPSTWTTWKVASTSLHLRWSCPSPPPSRGLSCTLLVVWTSTSKPSLQAGGF